LSVGQHGTRNEGQKLLVLSAFEALNSMMLDMRGNCPQGL
jgi:hypothetical protein